MRVIVVMVIVVCLVGFGRASMAQSQDPVSDQTRPMTAGMHLLTFDFSYGQSTASMPYGLYLSKPVVAAMAEGRKVPLVVFLCGKGSIGQTWDKLWREGPTAAAQKDEKFEETMNYAVLRPLVPTGDRWENERMATYVAQAAGRVIEGWPIDSSRVYLMGMSMGAEGVWHAALASPQMYRVVVSLGGRKHPEPDKVAKALKDQTILIVAGSVDKDFTTGSQAMIEAFEKVGADATYIELPGRGHDIWGFYTPRPAFYEWMLKHRHGEQAPSDRADASELSVWATKKPGDEAYNAFSEELQEKFEKFRPHWFIENCAKKDDAGLHEELLGRKSVFVTYPLNYSIPARIMTTAKIPADQSTMLHLEVASGAEGRWSLVVAAESYPLLKTVIRSPEKGHDPWETHDIDLTRFAGQEVFIEILHKRHGTSDAYAAWSKIELVSRDVEARGTP